MSTRTSSAPLWSPTSRVTCGIRRPAKEAFVKATGIAHAAGRKVALSLSDSFCVDRYRAEFLHLIRSKTVDIVFANESELHALYETADFDTAVSALREDCGLAAVTRGAEGALVIERDGTQAVRCFPVERVVDSTGASDLFAAGFLAGLARGRDAGRLRPARGAGGGRDHRPCRGPAGGRPFGPGGAERVCGLTPEGGAMLEVAEIRIYPVKGLRGIALQDAEVEPWGLARDRRWMVVDPQGRFVTQRQVPRMAVIGVELLGDGLRLGAEGLAPIEIAVPESRASPIQVVVWADELGAVPAGEAADRWLTRALGAPCRLVHMADPEVARPVDPAFGRPGDHVSFADGFPLLVTNTASLDDLNTRLERTASMDRFRANIVVRGASPWAEDDWRRLQVGGLIFDAVKDCARCAVTTVDQATGLKAPDTEPLRTLSTFRRKAGGRIIFGQNLVPRGTGRVRVGDRVASV